ncbi:metallophosphatase family protein [Denitromonas sp.]|uniref:metallophosphoesterase family protein n=1 Tax=Denitromonas sp. TaxID=2734609 RepID=UPI002AFFB09D|nr:metallophosphatase family protein [Denitromonas sp.]
MIRLAHFSDLHYGTKNLIEADRCFGAAIDRAIALGVEAAVLSGDATDHGLDLHAPAAERLFAQVRRLADHCPVLMLQGTFSHEPPGTLAIFRLLGGRHPVHVAERIEQVALIAEGKWLASTDWCFDRLPAGARALFSCAPTVNKAAVAAAVGAADAAQAVGENLACLLRGYAPTHRAARRQGMPAIGVSHGTVFGCVSEHGVPMAGFDHEFTTGALFAAEAQAFMLGHIHRHQSWAAEGAAGGQCIAYAGSIGRFHYGEEGEKGFLLWEVDADQARCMLEATPARRTVDIVFDGKPDLEALRATVAQLDVAGVFVRVRWTVADEDRHEVRPGGDRAATGWGGGDQAGGANCPRGAHAGGWDLATGESGGQGAGMGAGDRGAGRTVARLPARAVQPGTGSHCRGCAAEAGRSGVRGSRRDPYHPVFAAA